MTAVARAALATAQRRPLVVVAVVAFAVRAAVAAGVEGLAGGSLFLDDRTYSDLAGSLASGESSSWGGSQERLFRSVAVFLLPLAGLYRVFGQVDLAGQLLVATLGTATAVLATRLALEALAPLRAVVAGLALALLPSQVLWSSLVLKDAFVWAAAAAVALAAAIAFRTRGWMLVTSLAAAVSALGALAYLRQYTLLIAMYAFAAAAAIIPGPRHWQRALVAVATVMFLPLLTGFGVGGYRIVAGVGSFADVRQRGVVEANTAFAAEEELRDEGLDSDLRHLPRAMSVMLLEPYPWQATPTRGQMLAKIENLVFWYPLLGLGAIGAARRLHSHARVLLLPLLIAGGVWISYSFGEANFGTAYRHRGELVWPVAVAAAVGFDYLVKVRRPAANREAEPGRSRSPCAPAAPSSSAQGFSGP